MPVSIEGKAMPGNETSVPTWRRTSMNRWKADRLSLRDRPGARHSQMVERVQREVKFAPAVASFTGRALQFEAVAYLELLLALVAQFVGLLQLRFTDHSPLFRANLTIAFMSRGASCSVP